MNLESRTRTQLGQNKRVGTVYAHLERIMREVVLGFARLVEHLAG